MLSNIQFLLDGVWWGFAWFGNVEVMVSVLGRGLSLFDSSLLPGPRLPRLAISQLFDVPSPPFFPSFFQIKKYEAKINKDTVLNFPYVQKLPLLSYM